MQNHPPLILTPDDVSHPNKKYKFWNTSMAGTQKEPKNMSLVEASQLSNHVLGETQNVIQRAVPQRKDSFDSFASDQDKQAKDHDSIVGKPFDEEANYQQQKQRYQQKIQFLEGQVEQLRKSFQEGRKLNSNLLRQLNKATNQLRAAQTLNDQLNTQCDRLFNTVKMSHDRHSQVQNQKMALLTQISSLNQQKQFAISKNQLNQEQVEYLRKKIQTLYQQNSFEKSISNDLRKQVLILKQQFNKVLQVLHEHTELQKQVINTKDINYEIQQRIKVLQQQLKQARQKVQKSQICQEKQREQQNRLFIKIQELQAQGNILKEKIRLAEEQIRARNNQLNILGLNNQYEERYTKILGEYEKRNEDLVFQVMALSERNHKLVEEKEYYLRRVEASITNKYQRLPYDQFVEILKQTNADIQNLKKKLDFKQDEMQNMKFRFQQQNLNLRSRIEQLSNVIKVREKEIANKQQILENQIRIYKKQCDSMIKINEQLKNNQVRLRLQIMEKDKIIVSFIQRNKASNQIKSRIKVQQNHLKN